MTFVRCEDCGKVCRGGKRCPAYEDVQREIAAHEATHALRKEATDADAR